MRLKRGLESILKRLAIELDEEGGRIVVTDEDIAYIGKQSVLLAAARQDCLMNQKKESHLAKVLEKVPQAEFRPTTDPKSRKILDKKNPKDELANEMPYHDSERKDV